MNILSTPCLSRITAKSRIFRVTHAFTTGVTKDTRELAEMLFNSIKSEGGTVQMLHEENTHICPNGLASFRQFIRVEAGGHKFDFVVVHCISDIGTNAQHGDLCFYEIKFV